MNLLEFLYVHIINIFLLTWLCVCKKSYSCIESPQSSWTSIFNSTNWHTHAHSLCTYILANMSVHICVFMYVYKTSMFMQFSCVSFFSFGSTFCIYFLNCFSCFGALMLLFIPLWLHSVSVLSLSLSLSVVRCSPSDAVCCSLDLDH